MTSPFEFASALGPVMSDYLALKRALGRRYFSEERTLANLDRFLVARGPGGGRLTADAFAAWCLTLEHLHPTTRRNRMRMVRNLCLYWRRAEPACLVPDSSTFPTSLPSKRPYIFSEAEITDVLRAAAQLRPGPNSPLCGEVYRLAVVLLYTAGLRRGELLRLVLSDYDPIERTLLVRTSKFHKSRVVALSADAARELDAYLRVRRRFGRGAEAPLLVSSCRGLRAPSGGGIAQGLRRLFRRANVRTTAGRTPRVHDLRHTHAVHVLLRWYRAGGDVQAKLPALSTSMGHVSVASTAHYLSLLDCVAEMASERFSRHCAKFLPRDLDQGGAR